MFLWDELRRRNVFRVGAVYALTAWIIAQVVALIEEPLRLPDWLDTTVLVLLAIGFPIALLLAWAYELTPAGLRRTDTVPRDDSVTATTGRKLNYLIAGLVAGVAIGTGASWLAVQDGDARWLQEEAIPELDRLIDAGDWEGAYALAVRAQDRAPNDPTLVERRPRFSRLLSVASEPPGARVLRRRYGGGDADWLDLGVTPMEAERIPIGLSELKLELAGYAPVVRLWGPRVSSDTGGAPRIEEAEVLPVVTLDTADTLPAGKVRVPGTRQVIAGEPTTFADYFLGRYEVTNEEYKAFVTAGGYRRQEFWRHAIVRDGEEIPWADAMALFVDRSGRPGPSTWEAGDYPDGEGDYPVGGVSWYEAAAYAEFVGEELPTIYHARQAVVTGHGAWQLPASNLVGDAPAPVGQFPGVSWVGTYDAFGNVREWMFNALGDQRPSYGGGWSDPYSVYMGPFYQPPIERLPINGFRLAITQDDAMVHARLRAPLAVPREIDHAVPQPVSDDVFDVYRSIYAYDDLPLDAAIDAADRIEERNWIRERITLATAYGERMALYLYLPLVGSPPYQTVVFAPPGDAWTLDSADHLPMQLDFVVKAGRAVALPVLQGTFERRDEVGTGFARWGTQTGRDRIVQVVQDLSRALDYLATRRDIDSRAFAYYGNSMGGLFAAQSLATEPRFRVAVVTTAGFPFGNHEYLPEVDPGRFLARVEQPVLLLLGELDPVFPVETHARPWYNRLGTEAKRIIVSPGGHFVARDVLVRETLDWLDAHLGSPSRSGAAER